MADVDKLREVAERLNQVTDELMRPVLEVETYINSLNLGIKVWVRLPINTSEEKVKKTEFTSQYLFGYGKSKEKQWGLLVAEENDSFGYNEWLLMSAPRHIRIRVIPYLELVLKALRKEAVRIAKEMEQGTAWLKEAVQVIEAEFGPIEKKKP